MEQTFKHTCIKPACPNTYEDKDPDPYYCPSCQEKKKALALEVDKRLSAKPHKEIKSDLQHYEEIKNAQGINYRGIRAVPASQFFT
jgi:hypothetical protein